MIVAGFFTLASCTPKEKNLCEDFPLCTGLWRGFLVVPGGPLPFEMWLGTDSLWNYDIQIYNTDNDRIWAENLQRVNDSIFFEMPVFDSEIRAWYLQDSMAGYFINHARKDHKTIPFYAGIQNDIFNSRFRKPYVEENADFSGDWEVTFVYQGTDTSKAIGRFSNETEFFSGTFQTLTGDYRYLAGQVSGDSMFLSCFDGAHSFLFKAEMAGKDSIHGGFWSGTHWYEEWWAIKNPNFTLPSADSLTTMREGFGTISFNLPDLDSNLVSLSDKKFRNRVVILQIMGSWCPNCRDESFFLQEMYKKNKEKGLEVVGMGFETTDDFHTGSRNLKALKDYVGIEYPLVYAGEAKKENTDKLLPMLNHVMSYPTTLFIDKSGKVRKILTGYYGPATGSLHEQQSELIQNTVDTLLLQE